MKTDDELVESTRKWYRSAMDDQKEWRTEAKMCFDFYAGHQWSTDEMAEMEEQLP